MQTIDQSWANGRFQLQQSPTPDLDARLLLEYVLGVNHAYLVAHGEQLLTAVQHNTYQTLITRATHHEPIPYILGQAAFFDFELTVSPAVLIPRPETEMLVELVLKRLRTQANAHVIDVGTGSGCIPIAIARRCPSCTVTAVDISPKALTLAQQNAARLAPNRICFVHSDLLARTTGHFDLIVANLPYITDDEWTRLDDGVKLHEPVLALKGGQDGLDLIRQLLNQAQTKLTTHGAIFLEIGWQQGPAVLTLAQQAFPHATVQLYKDYAGHERIISCEL
jgi:release factor glutamine methyltransferase